MTIHMPSDLKRPRPQPSWSAIDTDILQEIWSRVGDDVDYIRFRSVCSPWRSATPKRPRIPWLVTESDGTFSLSCPKPGVYRSPQLPENVSQGKFTVGSCAGWLSLIDESLAITLHNPITGAHLSLPVIAGMPWMTRSHPFEKQTAYWLVYKLLFTSHPMDDNCVFIALACNTYSLIYCRPKDDSWTPFPVKYGLSDFNFYKGKVYAVCRYNVFFCDYQAHDPTVTKLLPYRPLFSDDREGYRFAHASNNFLITFLVESSGDMLLVAIEIPHPRSKCMVYPCTDCNRFTFEVFRVDLVFGDQSQLSNFSLVKIHTLGGRALFLGKSMSVSVSPAKSTRYKPNCIYVAMSISVPEVDLPYPYHDITYCFTYGYGVDDIKMKHLIAVFNMDDGSITFSDGRMDVTGFIWLTPSLC